NYQSHEPHQKPALNLSYKTIIECEEVQPHGHVDEDSTDLKPRTTRSARRKKLNSTFVNFVV
ncbi:MAG: hypothetical protein PVH43_11320, partial [Desulfobacterales bacterium]